MDVIKDIQEAAIGSTFFTHLETMAVETFGAEHKAKALDCHMKYVEDGHKADVSHRDAAVKAALASEANFGKTIVEMYRCYLNNSTATPADGGTVRKDISSEDENKEE